MITDRLLTTAQECLRGRHLPRLAALLAPLHPGVIADLLRQLPRRDQVTVLLLLPGEEAAVVLESLTADEQVTLAEALADEQLVPLLNEMATDEVTDLLGELPADRAGRLLRLMRREDATAVERLLAYPEHTAGGLMVTDLVTIGPDLAVREAIEAVRARGQEVELLYYVYVTEADRLAGVVTLRELLVASPEHRIRDIMHTRLITVSPLDDQEAVASVARKYGLLAVPVVDPTARLLGVVTSDDLLGVVEAEGTEDVLSLSGVPSDAQVGARVFPWDVLVRRTGFLVLNLFLNILAALVISRFADTLSAALALAFFIPALIGTAGNVGTQSMALAVRGMATGRFETGRLRHAGREVATGAVVGAVCGLIVGAYAALWQGDLLLGTVVAGAMGLALLAAAPVGMLIPFGLARLGVDPAIASGPLITTVTDNTTLLIYLLLATLLLGVVLG